MPCAIFFPLRSCSWKRVVGLSLLIDICFVVFISKNIIKNYCSNSYALNFSFKEW